MISSRVLGGGATENYFFREVGPVLRLCDYFRHWQLNGGHITFRRHDANEWRLYYYFFLQFAAGIDVEIYYAEHKFYIAENI